MNKQRDMFFLISLIFLNMPPKRKATRAKKAKPTLKHGDAFPRGQVSEADYQKYHAVLNSLLNKGTPPKQARFFATGAVKGFEDRYQ
jgi:hypothetical protein